MAGHGGRSPQELAREFEPTAQSIKNWVGQVARDSGPAAAQRSADQATP